MEINNIFGLPAHPIFVHAAVVLLPLAALGSILVAAKPGWRKYYAPLVMAIAIAAVGSVGLAQGSGEKLEDRIVETKLVEAHTDAGESVLPWAFAVALVATATASLPLVQRRLPKISPRNLTLGLVFASVVVGAGSTWVVASVGHSGAKATWEDTPAASLQENGDDDDDDDD